MQPQLCMNACVHLHFCMIAYLHWDICMDAYYNLRFCCYSCLHLHLSTKSFVWSQFCTYARLHFYVCFFAVSTVHRNFQDMQTCKSANMQTCVRAKMRIHAHATKCSDRCANKLAVSTVGYRCKIYAPVLFFTFAPVLFFMFAPVQH
jgi:hypothetical protein